MSDCPYCRQPGAQRLLWKVRCPNAACPKYDPGMSAGTLSRARKPMAGSRGKTGPVSGGPENPAGKPFNWRLLFGGLLILFGVLSLLGLFRIYIGNRGFMWGLALLYLGWKIIQGSGPSAPGQDGADAAEEEGGGAEAEAEGMDSLDRDKTSRILFRSDDGLTEFIVLKRSVTVNGGEVTAMDSVSGGWETFSAASIANLDEVKQIARDNGQNYG